MRDNQDTDPVDIYYNYGSIVEESPVEGDIVGDAVEGISGDGGGTTTGPNITLSGGVTGYQFNVSGNTGTLAVANAGTIRTSIGLGTIATQNANNVNISGGVVSGITDLAVADGGTGASTAAAARTNLQVARTHVTGAAPAASDDGAAGFPVGTIWVDTAADDAYISVDDSAAAAIWKKITP